MVDSYRPSFAFIVISYNHENYILEHLESIKFQILTYGADLDVDIIISDDSSTDNTRYLIDIWLALNNDLFKNIELLYNSENLGTCASVANAIRHVSADRCKLTASDDVYSCENIFLLSEFRSEESMRSGRVLYLKGSTIKTDIFTTAFETATDVIYKKSSSLYRFKHISITNAPNLIYNIACLRNQNVREYLSRFDVVEDWPLQVSIAQHFPEKRVTLIDHVLVYYRRTVGSTYIVANERFLKDKERLYDDFLVNSTSKLESLRITSRKKSLRRGVIMKKICNLDTYFFVMAALTRLISIIYRTRKVDLKIDQHRAHYHYIHERARMFRIQILNEENYRSTATLDQ